MWDDLLSALSPRRRAHSLAVGAKVRRECWRVRPGLRADVAAAATLHDIGYAHVVTGFHPVDGAAYLAGLGFSPVVCDLVAGHSASGVEAAVRGLHADVFAPFAAALSPEDRAACEGVLWWADMTTSPDGGDVTVEARLAEIAQRYGPGDVVTRFIERARPVLLGAGQSPAGSK